MSAHKRPRPRPQARYSRAPIIAAGFSLLLMLGPVVLGGQGILVFFSLLGLGIVVGGVIAVAFMSFEAEDVRTALTTVARLFKEPIWAREDLTHDLETILKWSRVLTRRGTRNLDADIAEEDLVDGFVKYGLNMVLSDYEPDEVLGMLETAAEASYERDCKVVDILQAMASHAPAFGMIGTLLGMVALLSNLTDNVSAVAPSLAVAFLATFYGVFSARMVYMPAAARLRHEIDLRRFRHHFITQGMVMLCGRKSPTQIQDRLNSFLRPDALNYFDYFDKSTRHGVASPLKVIGV